MLSRGSMPEPGMRASGGRPLDRRAVLRYILPMSTHDHDHGSELSEMQLRVRALETVLAEKGYIDPAALDLIVEAYETRIGPQNGARVVAKAWTDPDFKRRLLADGSAAVRSLGYENRVGDHLVVVENTEHVHNMV